MSENSKHIDLLIARFISGEASDAEQLELRQWMEQSTKNRKQFDQIRFADNQAVASHRLVNVDVDKAWQKLHLKMKTGSPEKTAKKKSRTISMPILLRIAAMVVLVSGLALALYRHNQSIQHREVLVASAGEVLHYTLADSSAITLNYNSRITYAANYGKKERRVFLAGEAFFDVQHIENIPFIVETANTFVQVTGTSFNIKEAETDSLVEVYVKSGSVLFFTANNEGVSLFAGETGIYNKINQTFVKTTQSNVNTTAYANRIFVFYNTTLNEVIEQLGRVYETPIELQNHEAGLCTITVSFNDDDLPIMLSIIAETLDLELNYENGRYLLSGIGCTATE